MRRAVLAWVILGAIMFGAAAAGVAVLNATAFGAAGFVRVYLEAIARGDAEGALGMSGVEVDPRVRHDFLADEALAGIREVREISVQPGEHGTEVVTFAWVVEDTERFSRFTVERIGARFGVFPRWAFAVPPIATIELTVSHDDRFELNGVSARSGLRANDSVAYAVLVPGVYRAEHRSRFLESAAVDVVADRPAARIEATVDVQAADALRDEVTRQAHDHLRECASQEVLFPTGCPLGRAIPNRVISPPEWSIVAFPELTVEPGAVFGTWWVPPADFVAHLRVDVQSLFDGSVSTLDEDIPFTVGYVVTLGPDDATLRIVPQGF